MIILGIHDGHNASAALIVDGKLVWQLEKKGSQEISTNMDILKKQ